jgi:hypothetical protein
MRIKKTRRQNKFSSAALKLLRDPHFFYRLANKIGDLGIIGERRNCLILFLAGLTKSLDKPVSVLTKGNSSTGKSESVKGVIALFPPESVLIRASMSKKAPVHGSDDLSGKILYIAEYRGAKDALYLTRLLQSEGAIQHEYTTVRGRERETVVATRKGSPVIFSTTTERRVFEDDETRFLSIQADDSPEQTQEVIAAQFRPALEGLREPELPVWQEAIRSLCKRTPKFLYPSWFDCLAKQIPPDEPRARRDAVRFLSLLKAIVLCRSYSDGRIKERASGIEISFADYCVAYHLLNRSFSSTFVGAHPRAIGLAKGVSRLNKTLKRPVTVREVATALHWEPALVYKYVKEAQSRNLVDYEEGSHLWNRKRLLPGLVSRPGFLPAPDFMLRNCKGVGNQARYVDPLTGKTVVLKRARWIGEAE